MFIVRLITFSNAISCLWIHIVNKMLIKLLSVKRRAGMLFGLVDFDAVV